ncbi:MAG: hypothetical protein AAFV53_35770, partial [Myxococcota bacterium]
TDLLCTALMLAGCPEPAAPSPHRPAATDTALAFETADPTPVPAERYQSLTVRVTLDGEPAADVRVLQGGVPGEWRTDESGQVDIVLDRFVDGEVAVMAAHPEARIGGDDVDADAETVDIALSRYAHPDNPEYIFQDPGEPTRRGTTAQCAHCHVTINEQWFDSEHRSAATNPLLQDLYAGTAAALDDEARCTDAGGTWTDGRLPGGGVDKRCYLGDGALSAYNEDCLPGAPCDSPSVTGSCADCHAPGIDGALGGRDLLDAEGFAYDYGIHCDVCHRVEDVDLDAPAGVAGRLSLHRPSEPVSPPLGPWLPLTFGPNADTLNPRMGSVPRDHFKTAAICAGCHQLDEAVKLPGAVVDLERWPGGVLPIQSTYAEWLAGPFADRAPCQSCHMPPDPDVGNSANIEQLGIEAGIVAGWWRPPGQVRHHTWPGPRSETPDMLSLAATVSLDPAPGEDGTLTVRATVKNIGPGHALPSGEPLRSMALTVSARCDDLALDAISGDVVPDFGGYQDRQTADEDWQTWPGAQPGEHIRIIRQTGAWIDYDGFGPFGDGTFDAPQKGMPEEQFVGQSTIVSVSGDRVTLDRPLPDGDIAYRIADGDRAGAPGFGFARVMVGADGQRMVPHFLAVDIASDNRLMPQRAWTSTHRFAAGCDEPAITAKLWYRPIPTALARERGWDRPDTLMTEVRR